jgi:D-sedoheptulose 7-phosphate isomerase
MNKSDQLFYARKYISSTITILTRCLEEDGLLALEKAYMILNSCKHDRKLILLCGNGGSASDASHIATELVCRFERDRQAIKAISLSADPQILTAVGNDIDFDKVFSRQLEGLAQRGDALIILSTSGKSQNCLEAAKSARERGVSVILMTGEGKGGIRDYADVVVEVPSKRTAHIQEAHRVLYHVLCGWLEADSEIVK